jgi:hypothetical protein
MKKGLIILLILFLSVTNGSLSNAHEVTIAQSHELSADRHVDQKDGKAVHSHDVKPKSKYDLRDLDGKSRKHGHNHDHKAKSKYDLRDAHRHDHGHAHIHDHGDAHKHKHDDAHVHGHGAHEPGYDRVWGIGVSG